MKKINIFLTCLILASCNTSKKVVEEKQIKDSIVYVDRVRIDTIKIENVKTVTLPTYNTIEIPCDSSSQKQSYTTGGTTYKIIKEKGKVRVVFVQKKDSCMSSHGYKSVLKSKDSLQKVVERYTQTKEVVKQSFWGMLKANLYMILFFIILVLWILGITPMFIFKLIRKMLIGV